MTCGAAARTAMVAMIVKAVNVMRQSLSNTCSGDLEDDEDKDEDVQIEYHGRELPVFFCGGSVFVIPQLVCNHLLS